MAILKLGKEYLYFIFCTDNCYINHAHILNCVNLTTNKNKLLQWVYDDMEIKHFQQTCCNNCHDRHTFQAL